MNIQLNGKETLMNFATKDTLIEGDGSTTTLDTSTWYLIKAVATSGSALASDFVAGDVFRSANDVGDVPTLAEGDDVYPLILSKKCKVDLSLSNTKGMLDVTDDCSPDDSIQYIPDGFIDRTGSFSSMWKQDLKNGLPSNIEKTLNRFFDIVKDDGADTYTVTNKTDDEIILIIQKDQENTTSGNKNLFVIISVNLTDCTIDSPMKGFQNIDVSFNKGIEANSCIYQAVRA